MFKKPIHLPPGWPDNVPETVYIPNQIFVPIAWLGLLFIIIGIRRLVRSRHKQKEHVIST